MGTVRIFVRHADPDIEPERPACEWRLSDAGRERAARLGPVVRAWSPGAVWSSPEPKARETAEAIAAPSAVRVVDGLREHERSRVPWFADPAGFEAAVTRLFETPDECVFGGESAARAEDRFTGAVERSAGRTTGGPPVFVAHGTVMALHLGRILGRDALALWKEMGFGAMAVLSLREPRLLEWRPDG